MNIDPKQVLLNIDGTPIINGTEVKDGKANIRPLMLKDILSTALSHEDQDLRPMPSEKGRAGTLIILMEIQTEVELLAADIVFLTPRLNAVCGAVLYVRVMEALGELKIPSANGHKEPAPKEPSSNGAAKEAVVTDS